ncbi:Uncharacterised protein [uncultured archaeon]|nr:Uncharacterised protein [uncultured archaeon]
MRRKVIQIAESTQLISLPRKWCVERGIKRGDELEVEALGCRLTVTTDKGLQSESVEVDVTKLDRSSMMHLIRGLYKKGYDEIKLDFSRSITHHYRTEQDISISSVVHQEVNRCPGLEIVEEKKTYILLKVISNADPKELDNVLRRTFILISDTCKDLIMAAKNNDRILLESIEEKHDNVTRFISHSLRLINKRHDETKNTHFMYYTISMLDKIVDIAKETARNLLNYDKKMVVESHEIMEHICESYGMFYDLFYKFDLEKVHKITELKEKVYSDLIAKTKNVAPEEVLFLFDMYQALEIFNTLTETRMSMEY